MSEKQDFWAKIKQNLKQKDNQRLNLWIEPTELLNIQESDGNLEFQLGVPTFLHEYWITQNFLPNIREEIRNFYSNDFELKLIVDPAINKRNEASQSLAAESHLAKTLTQHQERTQSSFISNSYKPPEGLNLGTAKKETRSLSSNEQLTSSYTFSSFVVGRNNEFAHAACHSVAENPAARKYNPLFIYGPTGLGKTHLLNAVGNHILTNNPSIRIRYVTGSRFFNECIASIRRQEMDKFRQRYCEDSDLLLLDDVHIFNRGEAVQEEFFHILNEYLETNRQVVVSSDKMPKDIKGLAERIRTRLEWGLIADIQMPDVETRIAILRYKAEQQNIKLPADVVNYIARTFKKSIRELEGSLNKVKIFSDLNGVNIDINLCKKILEAHVDQRTLTVEEVQQMVADHYKVRVSDLKSKSRIKPIVTARQVAMFLIKQHLGKSLVEIGRAFGGRDHTTVINAVKRTEIQQSKDSDLASDIDELVTSIHNITGVQ
ncbi:MAG: chromosomal replication initiator protein DnaA [Bdellovibrionaceae bacterium]|nr:chromosomal replication initiator protein DnaA [Pseudobdellovibrionaceae bacterium]